jgi:hypothetical protein
MLPPAQPIQKNKRAKLKRFMCVESSSELLERRVESCEAIF